MSVTLELNFYYRTQNIDRYKLSFQKKEQSIISTKTKIYLDELDFGLCKDKLLVNIQLYIKNSKKNKVYYFYIYYGENKAYIQLDNLYDKAYEIIFTSTKNLNINGDSNSFTELDTMGNKDKKRLILINSSIQYLEINDKLYNLLTIIYNNCIVDNSNDSIQSFQLSEINLDLNSDDAFIVKQFAPKKKCDINFIINNEKNYRNFTNELFLLFDKSNEDFENELKNLISKYNDLANYNYTYFHQSNEYLNKLFESYKNLDIEIFYNFFVCLYFFENITYYKSNRSIFQKFVLKIKYITNYNIAPLETELHKKISTLNSLFYMNDNFTREEQLNSLNVKIYEMTNITNNNSILDKVIKFFNRYIDGLKEDSPVYYYLSFLDGGYGMYKKEFVYTYDLTSLKILKMHLKEVLSKNIIFCYIENSEIASTLPEFNGGYINEFHLLKNYKNFDNIKNIIYDYPTNNLNEEIVDDISMNIVLNMIHENFGHQKYDLGETGTNSPKKIINKNNQLIELKHISQFDPNNKNDNDEYILSRIQNKGDSGHFLELSFGKVDNVLITKILFDMKNKGKLIYRPDLFLDNGEKLKEYVTLRNSIEKKNINYIIDNKKSIEDDIEAMKTIITDFEKKELKKQNITDNSEQKNEYLSKKRIKQEDNIELTKEKKNKKLLKDTESEDMQSNIMDNLGNKDMEKDILPKKSLKEMKEEEIRLAKERVIKKFGFKDDILLKNNMIKKFKEIDSKDEMFGDLFIALTEHNKKL